MKSPALCRNRGSLLIEVIVAMSIGAIFITSATTLSYIARNAPGMVKEKIDSLKYTDEKLTESLNDIDDIPYISINTKKVEQATGTIYLSTLRSNTLEAFGKNTCDSPVYTNIGNSPLDISVDEIRLLEPIENVITDIEVRNGIAYIAMNSSISSHRDFLILDTSTNQNISYINTGPGISSISIAGHYAYLANTSSISQLQILDIENRELPRMISTLQIPLPWATSSTPISSAIFYDKSTIYLGTEKWDGPEFVIVSVENPYSPSILSTVDLDTKIQDISVKGNVVYVGASDRSQLRIFNVEDKTDPYLLDEISPIGWQTQEGKVIELSTSSIYLGRTVGGFNNTSNHELFNLREDNDVLSRDIPGGIYGIREMYPWLLLATGKGEIDLWNISSFEKDKSIELNGFPVAMSCDRGSIYVAMRDSGGVISRVLIK
jgi:LVIVD repeat